MTYFDIKNFTPFVLIEQGGFKGTFTGAMLVFFAYSGFDLINTLADEAKNPAKTVPSSLVTSLVFCTFTYILISIALSGMTKFHLFGGDIAMPLAFQAMGLDWMAYIIYISAFMGITVTCFSSVLVRNYVTSNLLKLGSNKSPLFLLFRWSFTQSFQ